MGIRVTLLALLLAQAGVARAGDETAEAKRLHASGTNHFNLAEYEAALADLSAASPAARPWPR